MSTIVWPPTGRRVLGAAACGLIIAAGPVRDQASVTSPSQTLRAAVFQVIDASAPTMPTVPTMAAAAPNPPGCPPAVSAAPDPSRLPAPPAGARITTAAPTPACTYAVGYATIRKMHDAVIVNDPARSPAMSAVAINERLVSATGYFEVDSVGQFDFPDPSATTLAFGFMPITARIHFTASPATIVTVKAGTQAAKTTIGYTQTIAVYDVRLNGTPLNVGPDCRTAAPAETVLTGTAPGYQVLTGGPLTGHVDIPAFTGCRTPAGEDLDPLITASISGPGNVLDIAQGALCTSQSGCSGTPVPKPPTS